MQKAFAQRDDWFMSENSAVTDLIGEICKTRELLAKNRHFYEEFLATDLAALGKKTSTAMVLSI